MLVKCCIYLVIYVTRLWVLSCLLCIVPHVCPFPLRLHPIWSQLCAIVVVLVWWRKPASRQSQAAPDLQKIPEERVNPTIGGGHRTRQCLGEALLTPSCGASGPSYKVFLFIPARLSVSKFRFLVQSSASHFFSTLVLVGLNLLDT